MTLHVSCGYQCLGCGAFYLPFAPGVLCPKCGKTGDQTIDFVPQAAQSLRFNLQSYGSYWPAAWYVGSLGDHVLKLLFMVFEGFRKSGYAEERFEAYLEERLSAMDWAEQSYLKDHVRVIAVAVRVMLGGE
ncbi:MAG TPA: hypothetical protein DEB40_01500 [Elusimicrobia bacterium]|nr:hypothetical protein [Elusimicrobiota bacterium]HBT60405.1 hypothetical protein [Elusimicrobiota bacterium]